MKRIAAITGAAVALLTIIAVGGFKVGFPSWITLDTPPTPPVVPPAVQPATNPLPASMSVGDVLNMDLSLTQHSLLEGGPGEVYLVALLTAQSAAADRQARPPLNISLVMDRSGSMEVQGKMERAKEAAKRIVRLLSADDHLSIVAYSTDAEVLLSATSPTNLDEIYRIIDSIEPVGATNLSAGLELGSAEVEKHLSTQAINRVLVLSDGKANMGTKDPRELAELATTLTGNGMTVSTLGLGTDFNEDVLVEMAECGRGNFYFIESASQIVDVMQRELKGLLATVAKNVVLSLSPGDGVSVERVYGYRPSFHGSTVSIPVGTVSSGQQRKLVVKLRLDTNKAGVRPVADVDLTFDDLLVSHAAVSNKAIVGLTVTNEAAAVDRGRSTIALAHAEAALAAEQLDEAVRKLRARDDKRAVELLERQIDQTRTRNRVYRNEYLDVQVQHMESLLDEVKEGSLDNTRRSIAVKQGKAQSYRMMR